MINLQEKRQKSKWPNCEMKYEGTILLQMLKKI